MGNCLVTKLKGIVDNDNLNSYGKFELFCPYTDSDDKERRVLRAKPKPGKSIHVLSDSPVSEGQFSGRTEFTIPDGYFETVYFTNKIDGIHITIDSVYDVESFGSSYGWITKGFDSLITSISWFECNFQPLSDMQNFSLNNSLVGWGTNLYITYSDFANNLIDKSHFKSFSGTRGFYDEEISEFTRLQNTGSVRGNIEYLPTTIREINHPNGMYGSLENFINKLRNAGRTTGSIRFAYIGDNGNLVTYDGGYMYLKFNESGKTISVNNFVKWTSDTIELLDEVPSDFVGSENFGNHTLE